MKKKSVVSVTKRRKTRVKPATRRVSATRVKEKLHLADATGWLTENDQFFATLRTIVANRRRHLPRSLRRGGPTAYDLVSHLLGRAGSGRGDLSTRGREYILRKLQVKRDRRRR